MIKINIACVGNLKENYWKDAINEYSKRLSRFCKLNIIEVDECKENSSNNTQKIKQTECEELFKKLSGYTICLDKEGKMYSSEELSSMLEILASNGISEITFVVGGSNGLTKEFLENSKQRISFGKITLPHQLARVVLLEQIYRAFTIQNNITYHK